MNPEFEKVDTTVDEVPSANTAEAEAATTVPMNMSVEPGTISKVPPTTPEAAPDQQWEQFREQLYWLLTILPERLGETLAEYKQPLTWLGIIVAVIPVMALAVAVLRVINAVPLFAPTFELIGFGFTGWFIYRYLLFADRRQEFSQEIQGFKQRILGPRE